MYRSYFLFIICMIIRSVRPDCDQASVTVASGTHAPTGKICSGDLIFEENFDKLDTKIWQHENTLSGCGNWEFQWYRNSRKNSYVKDSVLNIKPTLLSDEFGEDFLTTGTLDVNGGSPADQCTNAINYGCLRTGTADNYLNPIASARLRTLESFSFKYGKFEARAKVPKGDWLWPAIWLLPRFNQYAGWPNSGEIDVMESRGNDNLLNPAGVNIGNKQVGSTLHWGPSNDLNRYDSTHYEQNNDAGYNSDFHKYQLEWTPDKISFSIDDQEIGTVAPPEGGFWELGGFDGTGAVNPWEGGTKMAPFDEEFYIIINLAVGGVNYFPDDSTNGGANKPWSNTSPTAIKDFWAGKDAWLSTWQTDTDNPNLQVDYVKVWAV